MRDGGLVMLLQGLMPKGRRPALTDEFSLIWLVAVYTSPRGFRTTAVVSTASRSYSSVRNSSHLGYSISGLARVPVYPSVFR